VIPIAVGQRGGFYDIIPQLMIRKGKKISEGGHDMLWGKQDELNLGLSTCFFTHR